MRLHRHDEIVEAMTLAMILHGNTLDKAAAALDAMLEAVVRLGGTIEPGDPCFVIPLEKPMQTGTLGHVDSGKTALTGIALRLAQDGITKP
jgi:hypothetical protein